MSDVAEIPDQAADNDDAQSKSKLIKHTLISLMSLLAIFIPINAFVFHLYPIAMIEVGFLIVILAGLWDFRRAKQLVRSSIFTAAIVTIVALTVVWGVQAAYSTGAWLLFPPIFYFFFFGKRTGGKLTLIYALGVFAFLIAHRDTWPALIENNHSTISTLVAIGIVFWLLIYRYEQVRQEALLSQGNSLKGDISQKEMLLNTIINSSSDWLFAKDKQLRTFLCNERFSQALGKQPIDLYGKTDIEIGWPVELVKGNPQKGIRGFEQDDRKALAGEVIHNDYDPATVNGEIRIFDTLKLPLRNKAGEVVGVLGISRDVTERRRVEESLRLQSEIAANAAEGIVLIKASDSTIYFTNRRFDDLFGYAAGELIGSPISLINASTDKSPEAIADEINAHIRRNGTYSGDVFNRRKDGSTLWTHIQVSVFEHPDVGTLWITYQSDISDRKRAERELIELNERLEKRVEQRTQELSESMHMLKEKEQAKTRFLAAASHDLRQPVAAATLFLEALKLANPTPQQNVLISKLENSMGIFSSQLERLLDISKFDAGLIQPQFQSFKLSVIFDWLEQNFANLVMDKGLRFKLYFPVGKPLVVRSDLALIETVLMNLVTNATKFTTRGGVMVSARQRKDSVLLQVWDTGIGIEEDQIPHIFDEFYQVANPQRNREAGLGLGLSICQRAVCVLGTTITCRSQPGRGSVFGLNLPLDPVSMELQQLSPIDESLMEATAVTHFKDKHIVVLEDDALVANAMVSLLENVGANVSQFVSAEAAYQLSAWWAADYFIVDYSLGTRTTGLDFLQAVQQRNAAKVRAVVVTGDTSSRFMALMKDATWPVLHKPANLEQIVTALTS